MNEPAFGVPRPAGAPFYHVPGFHSSFRTNSGSLAILAAIKRGLAISFGGLRLPFSV
jgi:hypothetical protein